MPYDSAGYHLRLSMAKTVLESLETGGSSPFEHTHQVLRDMRLPQRYMPGDYSPLEYACQVLRDMQRIQTYIPDGTPAVFSRTLAICLHFGVNPNDIYAMYTGFPRHNHGTNADAPGREHPLMMVCDLFQQLHPLCHSHTWNVSRIIKHSGRCLDQVGSLKKIVAMARSLASRGIFPTSTLILRVWRAGNLRGRKQAGT